MHPTKAMVDLRLDQSLRWNISTELRLSQVQDFLMKLVNRVLEEKETAHNLVEENKERQSGREH